MFKAATRKKLKLRMAIDGPSGSGKTYTALRLAFGLGSKIAVIDTEHRSASKYLGESPDGVPWQFDCCELEGGQYAPSTYTQIIKEAGRAGYDVLVIDSLSNAWEGAGGALDIVDRKGGNSFTAWKDVTPLHREMVEAILACPCHVIATMRSKMEYILEEETNKQGKTITVPKKIGMAPIQRQGMEYEFDIVADIDLSHTLTVSKSRCSAVDGLKAIKPGAAMVGPIKDWLETGMAVEEPAEAVVIQQPTGQPELTPAQSMLKEALDDSNKPGTDAQRQRIVDLAAVLCCGDEDEVRNLIKSALAKRNCEKLYQLTYVQAGSLIETMTTKVIEQGKEPPF
jgi:hypothetical protein